MPTVPPLFMRTKFPLLPIAGLLLIPLSLMAARFPDVPASNPHRTAIEQLADLGVIGGNPDGTFHPLDPVNRAAMLKMLYKAAKMEPQKVGGCFSDVEQGSWYELYVCDAATKGFVKGYGADGPPEKRTFKPAQPVTRSEAIKLTIAVFGIPQAELSAVVKAYTDVGAAEWFAPYIHTALVTKILPIAGQDGGMFRPSQLLERGEAAAYIWNALPVRQMIKLGTSSSAVSPAVTGSGAVSGETEIEKRAAKVRLILQQEQKALERSQANTRAITIPFTDKKTFDGKTPFSYEFTLTSSIVVDIQTALTDWDSGSLTCRLYHLGRSGFSQEYYLGFQDGKNCIIRAALGAGSWRLQLEPEKLSPSFTITAKIIKGDGNDGFTQAAALPLGQVRSDSLEGGDLEDWYTFTIPSDAKTVSDRGREMVLRVSSADALGCIIYPLDDVDQYGFSGPECGLKYLYPPGTYMVSVRHGIPLTVRQSFSIQIK